MIVKQIFHDNCVPTHYMTKVKKPKRSRRNGEFLKRSKQLELFGIEIYKLTDVVIGQGKKLTKSGKQEKERIFLHIGIAILLALVFAIIIEILKIVFPITF